MAGRLVPAGKLVPAEENKTQKQLGDLFNIGKKIIDPLVSKEQVLASPVGQMAASVVQPSMTYGPFLQSLMPPQMRQQTGAEQVSEETSPLNIMGNLAMLSGGLGGAFEGKVPKTREVGVKKAERYVKEAGGDVLEGTQNFLAENMNWKHWGRRIGVPEADTEVLLRFGGDEVERAGVATRTINTPQGPIIQHMPDIVESDYKRGLIPIRKGIGGFYDRVKTLNQEKINREEVSGLVAKIMDLKSKITDPNSKMPSFIEQEVGRIKGIQPQALKALGADTKMGLNLEQIENILQNSDFNKETTLNTLHSMAQTMDAEVSGKAWANPQSRNIEQQVASEISGLIKGYIGEKNPLYARANAQWRNMKDIEGEIYDVTPKLKIDRNKATNQTDKDAIENSLNKIDTYYKQHKLGQYVGKDRIDKYNAYNAWTNKNLGSFREGRVFDLAGQAVGGIGGALAGGTVGGPIGMAGGAVAGSTLGKSVGRALSVELMRPATYWNIVKRIKPGGIAKGISEPTQISHAAELIRLFMGGE